MGAVTKPLGGAAELVSQTGLGILQGVGLGHFPEARNVAVQQHAAEFSNANVKFSQ